MLEVVRKADRCDGEISIVAGDKTEYIRSLINIYAVCSLDRKDWLPERELRFFIATVIHVNEGIHNPIAKSALQIYKEYYNFKTDNKVINKIITLIEERGWLKYDIESKRVTIPALFYDLKDRFDFKIKVRHEEAEAYRRDSDGNSE